MQLKSTMRGCVLMRYLLWYEFFFSNRSQVALCVVHPFYGLFVHTNAHPCGSCPARMFGEADRPDRLDGEADRLDGDIDLADFCRPTDDPEF